MYVNDSNKIFTIDGKLCGSPYSVPKIEFEFPLSAFPSYVTLTNRPDGYISIRSNRSNKVYIDFGDGTVNDYPFENSIVFRNDTKIHYYTDDMSKHTIKIWFEYPRSITLFQWAVVSAEGSFFKNLNLYNIPELNVANAVFDYFPVDYGLTIADTIRFSNITKNVENSIPRWLCYSRVRRIVLSNVIVLINNNLHEIINNTILEEFAMNVTEIVTDIPSNFKHIQTLRYLAFGGSNMGINTITKNMNECRQLTSLHLGYHSRGFSSTDSGNFNSWGYGIMNMVNLQSFGVCVKGNNTVNPSEKFGLETCPNIKNLYFNSSFQDRSRLDLFIANIYDTVSTVSSKENANTQLRQVRFDISWVNESTGWHNRPSGLYQQPNSYLQGVNNGNPSTPMEMLWILVKQYRWTIAIMNTLENGIEILAP